MEVQGQPTVRIIPAGTTIKLPYHINPETGTGYTLEVPADTPEPALQAEIDQYFPKTLASLTNQLLDKDPTAPMLTKDEFMQVWNSAQAMDAGKAESQNQIKGGPGFFKKGFDVLKHMASYIGEGAAETLGIAASMAPSVDMTGSMDMDPNAQSKAGIKLLNGIMTGTGRLMDAAAVVGALAWDKIAGDPYSLYTTGKYAQQAEYMRKAQGYGMLPGSTQEEIDSGLKAGNILDITLLFPAVSALTKGMGKAGEAVAGQALEEFSKSLAQRSVDSLGRRALGQAMETAGGALERVGSVADIGSSFANKAIERVAMLTGVGDALTRGFLRTEAAKAGTGLGAVAIGTVLPDEGPLSYAGTALQAYGGLRFAQYAGAATKWAGRVLGSEELASKIMQDAMRSAEVQGAERLAVKLVKAAPDPVVRLTRKVLDGAMIPATIGATLSGAQEAADPFSTPLSVAQAATYGAAGGAAIGGAIGGTTGLAAELTGKAAQQAFVREVLTDIVTRPEERSFIINNQDVYIPDDIQNRLNVLNSENMTTRQKASLFGILDSAEHAGVDVAFINDATPLPEVLGGSGANMGKGVKFVNDAGRTTIFVNADQIDNVGAIHEVMHAYTSDAVATDFVRNLTKERGGELGAFQELGALAQKYYDTQVQTNPVAAEQIKASIDRMNDPSLPIQDRLVAATNLAHEYIAEGVSQSLADAKPESLQDFRGSAISAFADKAFRGALEKFQTATGMSSVGATRDPISGHFFKDGKIISSQPLADITKKIQTAINTRTPVRVSPEAIRTPFVEEIPKDVPFVGETMRDGGRVVAIEPRATYEDTHKNGELTTEAEKAIYHKMVFDQVAQSMGAEDATAVSIQQGVYPGNISKVGTPIIYTDKLTPQNISALFQVQTHHGQPLIAPENREAVARFAQALNDGHLVSVTHSVNVGKSTGKNRAYTVSISQVGLPMAFSQSSGRRGSGPKMEFFNLSLVNDMINLNRTQSPTIDAALKELKINTLDDVIPYAKAYIDNLSSTGSVPSARALAAVAPEKASVKNLEFMRDMLHMSSAVQPRKNTGEVRINEPYMNPEAFRNVPKTRFTAVTPQGKKFTTTLSRERQGIQSIRLDGISDVQLYQPNGQPVQIKVDKPQLINKIRANFSPANINREVLPNGEALTDASSGERIIITPKGTAKLFDPAGQLVGVFENEEAAVLKSNQAKLKAAAAETKARLSADVTKKVPELVDAAKQYRAGQITQQEYLNAVKLYAPYSEFKSIPEPSTMEGMQRALTKDKVSQIGRASQSLQAGDTVGLRLDIPAYRDHGEWVVSVHDQSPGGAGKVVGYEPVAIANNVEFSSSPAAAMGIATGEKPKSSFARMVGSWEPTSVEAALREARVAMESPEYIQVGMNPAKHSYFFDRKDGRPVVAADRVVQIGGLVFAKKPVFAQPSDARFATKQQVRFSPKAAETEANARPTLHRVFEGGQPVKVTGEGVFAAKQPELAFRITGEPQIKDIIESGVVRAREGKMRGGKSGETQWSRGHESLGYRASSNDNRYILVASSDINGLQGGLPASDLLQVLKSENGQWVDVTNEIKTSASSARGTADVRFSPRRPSIQERYAAERLAEERKYGMSSWEAPVSMLINEGEALVTARNQLVREETPTFQGKLADPELERRLDVSTAALEQAAAQAAVGKKVSKAQRIRKQLQARQAEIQAAVAKKEASGELGPVEIPSRRYTQMSELKALEDLPGGSPFKPQPKLEVSAQDLRRFFRNLEFEENVLPPEPTPAVTDLISEKIPRAQITHRTVLGNIQSDAAKAARVGDMKIDQMLKAMSEKREAFFDAELAKVRNKFDTMELQGRAEEARLAGIDPEIVRRRNEHFANVQQQIAQAAEPAPLNSGTPEPPAQTMLPNIATAADDPRIPREFAIQSSGGKFRIWSIGRQSVQAVTNTYQEALKKAQQLKLKRKK